MTAWFDVSKEGLSKLAGRRGKVFVLHELIQNSWDCDGARRVAITLEPVAGRPLAVLRVEDDDPDGFKDLTHSYTLFAESEKKANPKKRGRFNLGEKLVLALCEEAEIVSTTGGVRFDDEGRHTLRRRRDAGTVFEGTVRMTREELDEAIRAIGMVIPPEHISTTVNGVQIGNRAPVAKATAYLMTESCDADGVLHRPYETAEILIYRPGPDEKPHLYEMGIPVMELPDDAFHVSVGQKVPLSLERDAVTPFYLQSVRTAVLRSALPLVVGEKAASAAWVTDAISHYSVDDEAIRAVIRERFGEKAVIADPSDREAENRAKGMGYTVVSGGSLPAEAWAQVKRARALLPAGQVLPSAKPFSPEGAALRLAAMDDWNVHMHRVARLAVAIAEEAGQGPLVVQYALEAAWPYEGAYCQAADGNRVIINAGKLGEGWFGDRKKVLELLIHELAHHYGKHLEEAYDDGLARVGAAAVEVALRKPDLARGY